MQITNYEPKGRKNIPSVAISSGVYHILKEYYKNCYDFTDDPQVWSNIRKGLYRKCEIYFYKGTKNKIKDDNETRYYSNVREGLQHRIIINGRRLNGGIINILEELTNSVWYNEKVKLGLKNLQYEIGTSHKDLELRMDASLKDDVLVKCRPMDARKSFKAAVKKDFTEEEFIEFINQNGLTEEDKIAKGIKPLHTDTDTKGKVIKFEDCVYQDIHKAHGSWGLETFKNYPNCRKYFESHLKKAQEAKKADNIQEAKKHKDYVNLIVGCLGMLPKEGKKADWIFDGVLTRPLYNECTRITRSKIDAHIRQTRKSILESNELYANTDGYIMQHPDWSKVKNDKKIGEFGTEFVKNNEVWFYSVENSKDFTGYSIHQYFDEDGNKQIVGNLPNALKELVDLSKGIVITYKSTTDEIGDTDYLDVKQIKVEMEIR